MLRSQHRVYDDSGEVARTQDVWGAEGISGRVKFLPLAWAGMPKTSFRKNSDSPLSTALASVKDAIPQALLINGHNPLTLLHSALSEGLHNQTDEYCLEIANSVRVILAELSDRLGQALKDEAELNHALSKLIQENSTNKAKIKNVK